MRGSKHLSNQPAAWRGEFGGQSPHSILPLAPVSSTSSRVQNHEQEQSSGYQGSPLLTPWSNYLVELLGWTSWSNYFRVELLSFSIRVKLLSVELLSVELLSFKLLSRHQQSSHWWPFNKAAVNQEHVNQIKLLGVSINSPPLIEGTTVFPN